MDSTLWYQNQNQKLYVYRPDITIRDQNCLVCVNLSQSQNLYVYWPDLTFLDQIWRFGTRIVDSTQTPNQQPGWSVFFPNGNTHFDDQYQPSGFQNQQSGSQNQQRGTQNQQSGKARNNKSGRASYMPLSEKWKLSLFCFLGCLEHFIFFWKNEKFFGQNSMCLFGTLDPTHPPSPLFWDIVWDKVPKKRFFLTPSLSQPIRVSVMLCPLTKKVQTNTNAILIMNLEMLWDCTA